MPTYVVLMNWTEQGVKGFKDTVNRSREARAKLESMGISVRDIYWTAGRYDIVATMEAPDDMTISAALLQLASGGNLRTETLRAYNEREMEQIIQKLR